MSASTAAWLLFLAGGILAWFLKLSGTVPPGMANLLGLALMVGGFWALRHRLRP